jgi:hypothetical protein
MEGKDYHWSTMHKAWGRHKPVECKGVGIKMKNESTKKEPNDKRNLTLTRAMETIVQDQE